MTTCEFQVQVGVDSDGLTAAVKDWLAKKVESREAVYTDAFRKELMDYVESISGDFVKTETFTVSVA
jgi:hypothetical protein